MRWYVTATIYAVYGVLFAMVFMRLLRGEIRTSGMLSSDRNGAPSPERVQLLIASLFAMAAYGFDTLSQFQTVRAEARLPEPSTWLVAALGGSNALYLVSKIGRTLTGRT